MLFLLWPFSGLCTYPLSFLSFPYKYKGPWVFTINLVIFHALASCISSFPSSIFQQPSKTTLPTSDFIFCFFLPQHLYTAKLRCNQRNETLGTHSLVGTILNLSCSFHMIHIVNLIQEKETWDIFCLISLWNIKLLFLRNSGCHRKLTGNSHLSFIISTFL